VVAFGAVGPSASGQGSTASTTLTWSHTCAGSDTVLYVGVALGVTGDGGFTTTCTYNGVSMTSMGVVHSANGTNGYLEVFKLANPPTGSALTVLVTAAGGTPATLSGGSQSYSGVTGNGTPVTNFRTGVGALSAVVPGTTAGNLVVAFLACGTNGSTITAPATQRFAQSQLNSTAAGNSAGADQAAGGSVTIGWSAADDSAILAFEAQGPANVPVDMLQRFAPWYLPGVGASQGGGYGRQGIPGMPASTRFYRELPAWVSPDAAVTPVPLTEAGTSAETLAVTAAVPLAEAGTSAEVLAITQPVALTEAGVAADALGVAIPVALTEAGASSETLGVTAATAISLTDAGASTETLAVVIATAIPLTEAGASSETLTVSSAVPLTEAGAASNTLAVTSLVPLTEAGASSETLRITQATALTESGASSETLGAATAVPLTDAGASAETLGVTVATAISLTEAGAASNTLALLSPIGVSLTELGAAADALAFSVLTAPVTYGTARAGAGTIPHGARAVAGAPRAAAGTSTAPRAGRAAAGAPHAAAGDGRTATSKGAP
jgi:hypothetical protein